MFVRLNLVSVSSEQEVTAAVYSGSDLTLSCIVFRSRRQPQASDIRRFVYVEFCPLRLMPHFVNANEKRTRFSRRAPWKEQIRDAQ